MINRKFEGVWIPADLWFRKDLTLNEKIVYLEVKSLDNDFGCIATNKKLAEVVQLQPSTISGFLKSLENKGMIRIDYANCVTGEGRVIRICEDYATPSEIPTPPSEISGGASEISIHSNNNSIIVSKDTNVGLSASDKCELFIKKFNAIRKSKYQVNDKLCSSLKTRLKTYTSTQIFSALKNAMVTDYHIKNKFQFLTPEFILRVDKIELYLNADVDSDTSGEQNNHMPNLPEN